MAATEQLELGNVGCVVRLRGTMEWNHEHEEDRSCDGALRRGRSGRLSPRRDLRTIEAEWPRCAAARALVPGITSL